MSKKAYVFKVNQRQCGNGTYQMIACFPSLGVHVPYTFEAHSENECLQSVGKPIPCDDSCTHGLGHMENFVHEKIAAAAMSFRK